ncbi:MAG: hypothetical protein ACO1OT_14910 [Heyndrickxia sp.]
MLEKAFELAEHIASFSLPALALTKRAIDDGYEQPLLDGLIKEAEYFGRVF